MLSTVSSEDHLSCVVQYALKFVNELLVAASEKAVAIVQPRDNETDMLIRVTDALRLSACR